LLKIVSSKQILQTLSTLHLQTKLEF